MRLSHITIKNFKSIKHLELLIPETDEGRQGSADFVSIVGENNVGKSTILEAICLACPGTPKPTADQFPNLDPSKGAIMVEFEFNRLTERDKSEHAVRAHIFVEDGVEKYRVRKIWKSPGSAPEHYAYNPNAKQYEFHVWPDATTRKAFEAIGPEWRDVLAEADKIKKWTKPSKELFRQAAERIKSPLIREVASDPWSQNPGGVASSLDTVLPSAIYVPALRETGKQADVSEKQSAVRKIVTALFEQQLSKHEKVVRFRRAAADLEQLFAVEGKHKIITHVESRITSKLKELININADLRFIAPDVTADLASKTEFRVLDGDVSTRPEHQGHGAQRSIVLALLQMYAEQLREGENADRARTLFLIEEPEIYMHPEMCRRMRDALLKIAKSGIGQVICTTHSPVFLDLADRHDGILIVKKERGLPVAMQRFNDVFDQNDDDREQRARLRMILNFDPVASEVFFSNKVCLVEGDCEIAAVDAIARKLHSLGRIDWSAYLAARRSVAIINCRGKWTIPAFQKVLGAFGIRYRVVHDEDKSAAALKANALIAALLSPLDDRKVHSPNFESWMFHEEWLHDKPWKAACKINVANDVNPQLIEFFEFVLHQKIECLREPEGDAPPIKSTPPFLHPARRNLRNQLNIINGSIEDFQRADRFDRVIKIAAGPNCTPRGADDAHFFSTNGSPTKAFAIVLGDSMADTLRDGEVVELEFLNEANLYPVTEDAGKMPKNAFNDRIAHDGIYALAINDDIDQRSYTLKRVRVQELVGGGWLCQISADNPEASWGERGHVEIRKSDRVHFAARVVSLVNRPEASELNETEMIPSLDT